MPEERTAAQIFEELKETKKKVTIDDKEYYLAEGDLLMDETELMTYAYHLEALGKGDKDVLAVERRGLVGIVEEDRVVRWAKGLMLSYAVLKDTFATEEQYEDVVTWLEQATGDWENVCGVNYTHLSAWDDGDGPGEDEPLFVVMGYDSEGAWIALSFFPNHPPYRRHLLLDPSFFLNHGYSKVGVLRHELGHMLGWRHEHIRSGAPAICPDEDMGDAIVWGEYDATSVMHYFCGGMGTKEMEISELDAEYARAVYGPPDHEMRYFT
jgi:hypothetical protein